MRSLTIGHRPLEDGNVEKLTPIILGFLVVFSDVYRVTGRVEILTWECGGIVEKRLSFLDMLLWSETSTYDA